MGNRVNRGRLQYRGGHGLEVQGSTETVWSVVPLDDAEARIVGVASAVGEDTALGGEVTSTLTHTTTSPEGAVGGRGPFLWGSGFVERPPSRPVSLSPFSDPKIFQDRDG